MNKTVFNLDENIVSALCYLTMGVGGIVVLVLERDNKNARFHAMQAVLLMLASVVLGAALRILTIVPLLGWFASRALFLLSGVMSIVFVALCVAAFLDRKIKLPVLGDAADKQVN